MRSHRATFSYTRPSVCLLEKVAACVKRNEPVLLVGETGTGKTSSVQFLAQTLGHKLHVINLNQQSDSVDLLGGFKPVDLKFLMMPLRDEFVVLFRKTFSQQQNSKFLSHLQNCFTQKRWHDLLALMDHSYQGAAKLMKAREAEDTENSVKWQKLGKKWRKIGRRLRQLKAQVQETENVLAFSFMEGTLVKALKCGDWVLLDEINLAAAETLQCLAGLLESTDGSLVLTDRGNMDPVIRHPNFRLFACMNPATDVGKKDLTPGVRNRFTEFYVDELVEPEDLRTLVADYLRSLSLTSAQLNGIVNFYMEIRRQASSKLVDGTGHKPHYSLRTLCRALRFVNVHNCGTVARSLYEGFCLSFLTQLDRSSHPVVTKLICEHILGKAKKESILKQPLPQPSGGNHLQFGGYWISQGTLEPSVPDHYIITPSVKENLKDLARVVSAGSHPVLLQGETSVGKTSLITWLARSSGNHCVRVNNHEHTDLQEYVGCYAADESGKLVFKEGVLVEAMRKGYWIILDELNLAPTDVLEALNRLLDDNHELFIPETQEMVKAHPKFMLFATQNPPGHYGGRKMLSRAFRNRFVELHFDEIPKCELETILHQRCGIPPSYAKRLVVVMSDLQVRRQQTGLFAGKQSWMTLRDLFRWADRYKSPFAGDQDAGKSSKFYNFDQHMADHGYMLLAGRVRKAEETAVIQEVIEKHFKQCKVNPERLYNLSPHTSPTVLALLQAVTGQSSSSSSSSGVTGFEHVVWTHGMRRLAVLIGQAVQFGEPILLIGDTGCGKTTVCQLYAAMKGKQLHSVNCHLHTESADFLGGLRPVRSHSQDDSQNRKLFEWVDGPLVTSMKEGSMFLIDEISLADDSVLERLNSVLEPERSILLAEKGGGEGAGEEVEVVKAAEGFQVFATMNPGGDFGKKELSPALRNRFTEIWCPQSNGRDDLITIIEHNLRPGLHLANNQDGTSGFGAAIMDFVTWFSNNEIGKRCTVSIRDILSWVHFINTCTKGQGRGEGEGQAHSGLDPAVAFIHGACLVFLDSLGAGTTSRGSDFDTELARSTCLTFLQAQVKGTTGHDLSMEQLGIPVGVGKQRTSLNVELTKDSLAIFPFSISRESLDDDSGERYAIEAPTTCVNAQRILRGLQLSRPLLLEGAPGVGKTSLVAAVARLAGRELVRINLSEQTDVTDLFGADLPVEGGVGGAFAWRDGPFLQALKAGHWVVFDEMNLASQSVLEGLNACLDHRGEVFVPELCRTFHIQHSRTRIFACQNPLNQGGGRKGLPRSFLNRFTQVYVEPLSRDDLIFICTTMYPSMPLDVLTKMVDFNMKMHEETMVSCLWGRRGAPWEFNLRDINRWCDLLLANQAATRLDPGEYVSLVYQDRMRTDKDKQMVAQLYSQVFGENAQLYRPSRVVHITPSHVQAGHAFSRRACRVGGGGGGGDGGEVMMLHHSLGPLESLMTCVNMGWMAIVVGPSSSGKSSIVRLLAEVTGHTLHVLPMSSAMDTTELLGGFEQADIGRHIAELTEEVVTEVRAFQQQRSAEGDTAAVGQVTTLDTQLVALRAESGQDTEEEPGKEIETLLTRVHRLQKLVTKLKRLRPQSEQLKKLSESLKREEGALKKGHPGAGAAGGGTFEWVDSLLVKALRNGDWLLIDNVNFCSPSVLDRLNALLEPRGVLTINERGVTDGAVPTITPHPQFRLFLSMDPKNGEISRAMRNRGVEIYILGEEDGCPYSQHDTLSMLQGAGLHSQLACDWLMELHSQLREKLTANERPGLCDLLRSAMLVRQQQEKGMDVNSALRHAADSVYVRNMKSLVARQLVCTILSEQLERLKVFDSASKAVVSGQVEWWQLAPSVDQYRDYSGLTTAQQAARVCAALLCQTGLESICPNANTSMDDYLHSLQTALSIFVSHQSEKHWKLALDWLKALVNHKKGEVLVSLANQAPDDRQKLEEGLMRLVEMSEACLVKLFVGGALRELHDSEQKLCDGHSTALELLADQPWDLGTNPQVVGKVLTRMMQLGEKQDTVLMDRLTAISSAVKRLELLQLVTVLTEQMKDGVTTVAELGRRGLRQKSQSGKALFHLGELFTCLSEQLSDMVTCLSSATVDFLHQTQDCLLWLPRLLKESMNSGGIHKVEEVYLSQLALHWHWCWNKMLARLLTPASAPAVHSTITKVRNLLGDDTSAAKLFVKFWSSWGHPRAFLTETEARLWCEFCALSSSLLVDSSMTFQIAQQRVKVVTTSQGRTILRKLMFVAKRLLSGDFDVESDLLNIRQFLRAAQLIHEEEMAMVQTPTPATASPQSNTDPQTSTFVQLWPVYEHLDLLAELSHLLGFSAEGGEEMEKRVRLLDFELHCSTSAVCWDVSKEQELKAGDKMKWLLQVLQRLWSSPAVASCTQWLTWGTEAAQVDKHDTNGPAIFHRSAMLFYASHLLSSSHADRKSAFLTSQYDLLPLNVTLGGVDTQLTQLSDFTRLLWKHAGVLTDEKLSLGLLEEQLLAQSFLSLLKALSSIMDTDHQEEWTSFVSDFSNIHTTMSNTTTTELQAWQESSESVKSLLFQLHNHLNQHCGWLKDHAVVAILGRCFEVMVDVVVGGGSGVLVGQALVYVGSALLHLLAPKGPVDPVHKATVKLNHFRQELSDVETDLQVWEAYLTLTSGQTIQDLSPSLHHPRLAFLLHRRSDLVAAIADLEVQYAFRGDCSQYLRLSQEVTNIMETMASPNTVGALVSRLRAAVTSGRSEFCSMVATTTAAVREERTWQTATGRFSKRLGTEYPFLPDLAVPVCLAVEQMRLGMRVLAQEASLRLKQTQIQYWPPSGRLDSMVTELCAFPSVRPSTPTWLHLASHLSSLVTREAVTCLVTAHHAQGLPTQHLLSRLLSCSLLLAKTHALQTGEITSDLFTTLTHVLDLFVKAWQDQEDRRRQKEEEEASLYRFKDKQHGDERTEEEKEEEAFRKAFPSFRDDFADMIEATRLEDTGRTVQPMEEDDGTTAPDAITEQEMDDVCCNHLHLLLRLTSTQWFARQQLPGATTVGSWDVVKPALLAYQVAADIGRKSWQLLSEQVDKQSLGSHLVVCGTLAQSVQSSSTDTCQTQALRPPVSTCYNVYVDPNVEEVMRCRHVLQKFVARVTQLLQEWPDHPTLKQLLLLVERIESFPVTAPIVKFLTGMELLLEKAQLWEGNAASHVSMATQLSEVTALIVQWRKLELRCWSGALDIEVERCRRKASRWWFHLYTLVSTYLSQAQSETGMEELLNSLKQFIEGSSVGEFSPRLDIVLAFHCHLVHAPFSPQRDHLLNLLWSVHQFYSQFSPALDAEIANLRTPIEKELKGFVKIARWSEMNYWALKESTEKTHRTVHKHARAFQGQLNNPVKGFLGEKPADVLPPNTSASNNYRERILAFHTDSMQSCAKPVDVSLTHQTEEVLQPVLAQCCLQQTLLPKCRRAASHWRKFVAASGTCLDISRLDELTGDLMEEARELQKLEVPQGTDKTKQKSEVKHIHLRKRKALADCFKQLADLGLSYRKGLVKEKTTPVDDALQLPPFNPSAVLGKESKLLGLWEGCDTYFTKCLSRLAQLAAALKSPSKELGVDNVERCRGFAQHLADIFMKQRQELSDTFTRFVTLRKLLSAVETLESSDYLPSQTEAHQWLESAKNVVTQVAQGLTQFSLLLQSCPPASNTPEASPAVSPFLPADLSPMAHLKHGDELWSRSFTSVQMFLETTGGMQTKLLALSDRTIFTSKDVGTLTNTVTQLSTIQQGLREMADTLDNGNDNCLTTTITFLSSSIHKLHNDYATWRNKLHKLVPLKLSKELCFSGEVQTEVDKFAGKVEQLVESALLTVQKLVKSQEQERKKDTEKTNEQDDEEGEDGLKEKHLMLLTEQLGRHVSFLHSEQMTETLQELCNDLKEKTETSASSVDQKSLSAASQVSVCARLLLHSKPLLSLYGEIMENHVAKSLALHRTLGKMLSVMLAVFTQLALKGFCLPAEYSDDAGGEGATDFVDIEGGGVGEGEGAKDVSEQIESEDQLDETRKQDEEKEEGGDQQPDIAPEDNAIEMSDDFEAKPQDLEPVEGEEDEDNDDKEEEDPEKQMGDVDGPDSDKLDDQMWGSDGEDEADDKEQKEEDGPGSGPQGEKELAAKEDLQSGDDDDKDKGDDKKNEEEEEVDNNEDPVPQDVQDFDESEYDDNRVDPHHGEEEKPEEPENVDLPEDLNLDLDEEGEEEDTGGERPPGEGEEENTEVPDITEEGPEKEGEEHNDEEEAKDENKEQKDDEKKDENETGEQENEDQEMKMDGVEDEQDDKGGEKKEAAGQEEHDDQEQEGAEDKGFKPQDDPAASEEKEEMEEAENRGKSSHDDAGAVQNEDAQDEAAGENNNQEETEGAGTASTDQQDGHEGTTSAQVTEGTAPHHRKQTQRRPGQSQADRSLGTTEEKFKRLKTTDRSSQRPQPDKPSREEDEAEMYEHIADDTSHADAQTLDVATDEQQQQQSVVGKPEEDADEMDEDDDVKMQDDKEEEENEAGEKAAKDTGKRQQQQETEAGGEEKDGEPRKEIGKTEIAGSDVMTLGAERAPESTIHTQLEHLHLGAIASEVDVEALRGQLEDSINNWTHADTTDHHAAVAAGEAWQKYEALTSSLSQELCEQLRLVLEPSQATKLRGDYRTGKRLNMRKVIPYIASQFRKDKIWLRRTKPSKRQYQIMLAIDDSSSMADNHSKQLAFESLALTANALTLLETGDLAVCSFGETVKLLHPFTETFSNQAGARILQQFTFEQKQTRVALMLQQATAVMLEARSRQQGWLGRPETAQLLLMVSDGRGINAEGLGVVKKAVRQAREANIFLVFIILDDPKNQNSILDIKRTVFTPGKPLPEFRSYMEEFPFPFYVILRDIGSLPQVLSDALRQWFELVTATSS
ncbi:midasin-like isoform X1 [Littorina saxatilis]